MKFNYLIIIYLTFYTGTTALNNGAALKPPMGWSTWFSFRCYSLCTVWENHPLCYSEKNIQQVADVMVSEGYLQAGYEFVILDDCWQNVQRTEDYKLTADPNRFPNQISGLAQYVHSRGLKIGIFSDLGTSSGEGFPGSSGYLSEDATTFINWGIDYVKMSAASAYPYLLDSQYLEFGKNLLKSPKPIVYAVSWPVYKTFKGLPVDYNLVKSNANTWRYYGDMRETREGYWQALTQIMDYFTNNQAELNPLVERGAWNDPDIVNMLAIGNGLLTVDQAQTQMAVWCIIAAPLIISSDIRKIDDQYKAILLNRDAIAINQDYHVKPGYRAQTRNNVDIWIRKISPSSNDQYSYAIAFVNRNTYGFPIPFTITLAELDITNPEGYNIKDIFNPSNTLNEEMKVTFPTIPLQMTIKPMGVVFYRAKLVTTYQTRTVDVFYQGPEIIRYRF